VRRHRITGAPSCHALTTPSWSVTLLYGQLHWPNDKNLASTNLSATTFSVTTRKNRAL